MDDHQHEGNNQVEDEPDVDHLDVGGGGKAFIHLKNQHFLILSVQLLVRLTLTKRATKTSMEVRLIAMTDSK